MKPFSFLPFKNLGSSRLLLRRITPADVNKIFALRSNTEVMKYVARPLCRNLDDAMALIEMIEKKLETNEGINWAITLKGNNSLIGFIGHYRIKWEHFRSEIGYMVAPDFQGKGIITEAIKLVVDYGFSEMNMHSLEAVIDPKNIASARALEKNNFIKEAHFKENEFFDGRFINSVVYSLLDTKLK
jgi:ribosomal-protein-alanine N-acetyltransferase